MYSMSEQQAYGKFTYTKDNGKKGCLHYINSDYTISPLVDSVGGKGAMIILFCNNCGANQTKPFLWDDFGTELYEYYPKEELK